MREAFSISDIQDDEDIYGRLILNQKKRSKKRKVKERPSTLAEKVRLVEQKRNHSVNVEDLKGAEDDEDQSIASENLPVVINGDNLLGKGSSLFVSECKHIRDNYEDLELHHLFDNIRTNFLFRLFITAVSYEQRHNFHFEESEMFEHTLHNVVSQQQAKKEMRLKFVKKNYQPDTSYTAVESNEISRTTFEVKIPRRIIDLLDPRV